MKNNHIKAHTFSRFKYTKNFNIYKNNSMFYSPLILFSFKRLFLQPCVSSKHSSYLLASVQAISVWLLAASNTGFMPPKAPHLPRGTVNF